MEAFDIQETEPAFHWTEYGIPIRNLWHMLLYVWDVPPLDRMGVLDDIEDAPSLDALLASILVRLLEQRMRIGLGRSYCEEELLLRGIRGRINFSNSLKNRTFEHGQAYCHVEPYELNVPKNQIIRSTIMRLIRTGLFGPDLPRANELRQHLRRVVRAMEGVTFIDLTPDLIRRQQLGRNDRDYRLMLAICDLLLQRQMPTHDTGQTRLPGLDQSDYVMHHIYERFVACFYRTHLAGWWVEPQKTIHWHEMTPNKYLPKMQPDLVLTEKATGRNVVLDTKFTAGSLVTNRFGKKTFNSGHLYQLYTYLMTQAHLSQPHWVGSGILLYPSIDRSQLSERIELPNQTIRIETVDLTAPWQEIENRLLEIVVPTRNP